MSFVLLINRFADCFLFGYIFVGGALLVVLVEYACVFVITMLVI